MLWNKRSQAVRSPCTAIERSPRALRLETAHTQPQGPRTAKITEIKFKKNLEKMENRGKRKHIRQRECFKAEEVKVPFLGYCV